ncbi:hypothetical protein MPNT_10237 [Candidatus Methylacidithermus pantelleriae]|uniref:Uncharacterized protein n=1 Tax=Candidatus Methylacidithermus pantelleriae TaxID=2744239 RepID=A0A8J2BQ83_9BACT|nr:hypothetical protein MPNT_10237 [Candidatus Methylacidithermus pantelleriae]
MGKGHHEPLRQREKPPRSWKKRGTQVNLFFLLPVDFSMQKLPLRRLSRTGIVIFLVKGKRIG